jgi:hypothetical protein
VVIFDVHPKWDLYIDRLWDSLVFVVSGNVFVSGGEVAKKKTQAMSEGLFENRMASRRKSRTMRQSQRD